MKIYPDLQRIWSRDIKEAGMTKNQARKVIKESENNQKETTNFLENSTPSKNPITQLLKKLNAF